MINHAFHVLLSPFIVLSSLDGDLLYLTVSSFAIEQSTTPATPTVMYFTRYIRAVAVKNPAQASQSINPGVRGTQPIPPFERKRYVEPTMASQAKRHVAPRGIGIYINEGTGAITYQLSLNNGSRVISHGSQLKNSDVVTGDLGFKAPGLKWKGKNAVTAG
ncbi:hypothetical protein JCGZ_22072 [Jatropha curcas]|uniref:Uncharacterized protein n=1 Tax=Jatropha curcas TaxID=180498 RepID=A0A067K498_JATCU|nr:hypothetical protein JCGZ_22072 [Jatropha curcas]